MRRFSFVLIACSTLLVAACGPDRVTKDGKLENACLAAIRSLYDQSDVIEVQDVSFSSTTASDDTKLRVVSIKAHYVHSHGVIQEKEYSCAFEEPSFSLGYQPRFFNVDRGGVKIGNFDGDIQGSMEDFANLNKITEDALSP